MNTKKEIIDEIYYLLGEDQNAPVFDKEGKVMPKLHALIDAICRGKVANLITGQAIKSGLLDFIKKEKRIKVIRSMTLSEEIDEESETISLSSTQELKDEGVLAINGNIIRYNGKTDTQLLNISGVNGWHKAGSQVFFAFALPPQVIKVYDVWDNEGERTLPFVDMREQSKYAPHYTVKSQNGKQYLIFVNYEGSATISMTEKIDPMERDDDVCGLPDQYGLKILPPLIAGELLINTSEMQKGKELLIMGYNALEDMYSFYATPTKPWRKTIKSRSLSFNTW